MMSTDNESPRILRVAETASTNSLLRELVIKESLAEGSVVVADFQTAGRGQIGNTWESEAGKNLMFSLVLYPTCIPANRQFLISQIAALSVKEALDLYADHITVKWPNDIYWKDKKICGMLIENDLTGTHISRSIAGIGVNINQEAFTSPAPNPVSLKQITGQSYSPEQILASIMKRIKDYYALLQTENESVNSLIADRYTGSLFRKDGFHRYTDANGKFLARLLRVEPDGRLILEDQIGTERTYLFKEVQYDI